MMRPSGVATNDIRDEQPARWDRQVISLEVIS
jgi:hypothetical protein